MASVNKVIIVGNLGRDPEIRFTAAGDAIANIAVATSYRARDRSTGEQEERTEWHRIALFGRLAEIVGQFLRKGASVYVEGRLQTRKFTDKEGVARYSTDIVAENMQMLSGEQINEALPAPAQLQEAVHVSGPATAAYAAAQRAKTGHTSAS